jgi:hypothetical protein
MSTTIHHSEVCACEQCRWASGQIETNSKGSLWADAATIRAAIFDIVDDAEFYQWMWDKNETNANAVRGEFTDAVLRRLHELQSPPHNAPRLEALCPTHLRRKLAPYSGWCVECPRDGELTDSAKQTAEKVQGR